MAQGSSVPELCHRATHSQGRARAIAALFLNHASGAEASRRARDEHPATGPWPRFAVRGSAACPTGFLGPEWFG